ncbi:MAG TPA: oligosaccharide flippase family protein [Acidimicrobiia bacterium]|nr:oligosaccharide flippase family protein [Acidimicrobiia bacterium]
MRTAGRRSTIDETESQVSADGPKASSSLLTGTGVLFAGRVVVAALGWAGQILITRRLTTQVYGEFSLVFSVLGLLGLVADFQTSRIVIGEILEARDDLGGLVSSFLTFRVALGALMYAIAVGFVLVAHYPHIVLEATLIGGLSFFIASATWALVTVCQAFLWLRTVALSMIVAQAVQFGVTVALFVTHSHAMLHYVVPFVIYDAVTLVWMLVALNRVVRVRPRVELAHWWHWTKDAAPLAIGATLGTAYFRIDGVMLSKLGNFSALAVYQIGYKFSDLLAFAAPALLGAVLPLLIRSWPDATADFRKTFRQAFVIFIAFGTFAVVTFAVMCAPAIHLLYEPSYWHAVRPARLLVVGQALNLFTELTFVTLVAAGRRGIYPIATLIGFVANIALNFLFIPLWSATGAGIATIVTEVIVLAILVYGVRDLPIRPLPWRSIGVVALSAGALALSLLGMRRVMPWELATVIGMLLYGGFLQALRLEGTGLIGFVRESRFGASEALPG